jgi:tetratricopeptide (TPR) repeat protein
MKREYDKAIVNLTKEIRIDPDDATAYYSRGLVHYAREGYGQTAADFTKAAKIDPAYTKRVYRMITISKKGLGS